MKTLSLALLLTGVLPVSILQAEPLLVTPETVNGTQVTTEILSPSSTFSVASDYSNVAQPRYFVVERATGAARELPLSTRPTSLDVDDQGTAYVTTNHSFVCPSPDQISGRLVSSTPDGATQTLVEATAQQLIWQTHAITNGVIYVLSTGEYIPPSGVSQSCLFSPNSFAIYARLLDGQSQTLVEKSPSQSPATIQSMRLSNGRIFLIAASGSVTGASKWWVFTSSGTIENQGEVEIPQGGIRGSAASTVFFSSFSRPTTVYLSLDTATGSLSQINPSYLPNYTPIVMKDNYAVVSPAASKKYSSTYSTNGSYFLVYNQQLTNLQCLLPASVSLTDYPVAPQFTNDSVVHLARSSAGLFSMQFKFANQDTPSTCADVRVAFKGCRVKAKLTANGTYRLPKQFSASRLPSGCGLRLHVTNSSGQPIAKLPVTGKERSNGKRWTLKKKTSAAGAASLSVPIAYMCRARSRSVTIQLGNENSVTRTEYIKIAIPKCS